MGEDLYKPTADFICSNSRSTMAFSTLVVRLVVAPTPVSAVMHAGIVNAGGMMLTRFRPSS